MTEAEYQSKLASYKTSDAPLEIKEAAIKELQDAHLTVTDLAVQQYIDGQPDNSDVLTQE